MASTRVISIRGRDRIERRGLYFAVVNHRRRSVCQQLSGEIELADLCTCSYDWRPDFQVVRSGACVIDQHRIEAMKNWRDVG